MPAQEWEAGAAYWGPLGAQGAPLLLCTLPSSLPPPSPSFPLSSAVSATGQALGAAEMRLESPLQAEEAWPAAPQPRGCALQKDLRVPEL